uniref:Uncharacterized protein n=1 Tax=Lactuca sativa TaxID=4236 RepID=A0A9R1WEF7_LACSA|nr:hypothetical protein LSAT_V11C200092930 [Lactuca sativa]
MFKIKALKKDVVKLFENLDKYDDGANFFDDQHQGPVSATSSILGDKILGLARFFLGIGIPGNSKGLYHQIDALDCLDQNRQCLKLILGVCEQTCAGAVVLTDLVFWCLLVPFQSGDGFKLTLLIGCMHSLNVVFLLQDSALNSLVSDWIAFTNWLFTILMILISVELMPLSHCLSFSCAPCSNLLGTEAIAGDLIPSWKLLLHRLPCDMTYHILQVLWHCFSSPSMLRTICLACESESIDAVKNVSVSIYSPACGFRLQSTKEKDHTTR